MKRALLMGLLVTSGCVRAPAPTAATAHLAEVPSVFHTALLGSSTLEPFAADEVLVPKATAPLGAGAVLEGPRVAWVRAVSSTVPPGVPTDPSQVYGRVVAEEIKAGEWLRDERLGAREPLDAVDVVLDPQAYTSVPRPESSASPCLPSDTCVLAILAVADLPAGTVLGAEHLYAVEVHPSQRQEGARTPDDVVGRLTCSTIYANEPVRVDRLSVDDGGCR